jgi:ABC-type branched-subunit amino acid transport system ATPase component
MVCPNDIAEETPRSSVGDVRDAPVLLRASGIGKSFGGQTVLDGIDLNLRRGEVVLLRGENGSGKTTLLNILTGNLEPDDGTIHYSIDDTPRSYRFPRRWWQDLNPWDHFRPEFVAKEGLGRTWQDIRLFGSLNLRDNISVAEPGHPGENPVLALCAPGTARRRESEIDAAADKILHGFGLGGREESSADMVSLGQSKRVAIARAVAAGAKVLFLDEPLAGLDRPGIDSVLAILKKLVKDEHLTLVIIEHVFNQPHLKGLITTDWLLERGKLQRSEVREKRSELEDHHPSPVTRHSSQTTRPAWFPLLAGNDAKIIDEPLPRGAVLTRIRRPDRWKGVANPVLEIKGLIVKRGRRTVIGLDDDRNETGLNLTLYEGEIAILQAPNGWGKSTLFDAICGQAPTAGGSVVLNDQSFESMPSWNRVRLGLFPGPSAATLFPSLTVGEAAKLSPHFELNADSPLPFLNRTISSLSGGEKQKTLLTLNLPKSKKLGLTMLDEPFAMLDDQAIQQMTHNIIGLHVCRPIMLFTPISQITTR